MKDLIWSVCVGCKFAKNNFKNLFWILTLTIHSLVEKYFLNQYYTWLSAEN